MALTLREVQKRRLVVLFIGAITTHVVSIAQDSIIDQEVKVNQQFWIDYNFSNSLNDHLNLNTQIGFRKINPEVYNRVLVTTTLDIKNNKNILGLNKKKPFIKSFHLGSSLIYTQNYNSNDNFELRLIQGLKFDFTTIKPITFFNYIRLEERFQNNFNNSGWNGAYRLRYRLSTVLNWKKRYLTFVEGLYVPLQAEVFFNLKKADRFNDLMRLSPGLGYRFKNDWRYELYVIFNRTKNITNTNNTSNDFILRLRIYQGNSKKDVLNINEDPGF